ncbi:alpha/beta hydrolase fold domain-containing protein [Mycolicibacterium vinylchloridicum]|uniref:alpha/beta hydrolase fold domain-containing protein n=1 Tax=Mycolicibacterium vinylchloridicum TaxID=2736928 RepID=UPI0015CBCB5F|nr:alpha/beta hydrolase [Mycolicibacterium vinylchloridicum]
MAASALVGRIGGLAAALGVGAGIAIAAQGVASADAGSSPSGAASSSSAKPAASTARHKVRTVQTVAASSKAAPNRIPKAPNAVAVALSVAGVTRRGDETASGSTAAPPAAATSARVPAKAEAVSAEAAPPVDESLYSGPPPTMVQRAVVGVLRAINWVTTTFHLPFSLSGSSAQIPFFTDGVPDSFLLSGIKAEKTEYEGMAVWTLTPRNASGQYVVGIHGGSFIGQISIFHWLTYTDMARDTGATVVVPLYTLAPVGNAATDIPVMADFISAQVAAHGSDNVSVVGDSAGGNIALAALQEIVKRNGTQPHRLLLLAPALDLSDTFENPVDDPLLGNGRSGDNNDLLTWAGDLDPADPLVSPIYGSLDGLPPTTVYTSSRDLLTQQALRLRDKAIAEDADFTFVLREGQFHDWTIFALPDSYRERPGIYSALGL